jgi:hypothetical protein
MLKAFRILILAAIVCPAVMQAQVCEDDLCIPREIIVKTSLTGPLQLASYASLGIEVPIYKQMSVQAEGLYIYQYSFNQTKLNRGRNSAGLKVDLKYYLPKSTTLRIYTGPCISYRNMYTNTGRIEWRDETTDDGTTVSMPYLVMQNPTGVRTSNTDFLWQVGVQPFVLRHFALNIFTGAGLGIQSTHVISGPRPLDAPKKNSTYFSKIFGVQLGFTF